MKQHTRRKRKTAAVVAALCTMLFSAGTVFADTDGTELQVAQPSQLEIPNADRFGNLSWRHHC